MRVFLFFFLFMLSSYKGMAQGQNPVDSISAPAGFQLRDDVFAVYDSFSQVYRMNFVDGDRFYRRIYDTAFTLLDEYVVSHSTLMLSSFPETGKSNFSLPLVTRKGYFEAYTIERSLDIYKVDFENKKDSLVAHFDFDPQARSGERVASLIPGENGLKILTFSKILNAFNVYEWKPDDSVRKYLFELPEKSLTKDEEKMYDKVTQIKIKTLWKDTYVPSQINKVQVLPAANQLYYTESRIYIILPIPYGMGIFLIDLDLVNKKIQTRNYFLNNLRVNSGDDQYAKMKPVAMILDSTIVIQNSSFHRFEFYFYDLHSPVLRRKFSVPVKDSFFYLVHSPLWQKGSFASKNEEKEIEKGKAFMRKVEGDFSFVTIPYFDKDSVIFTVARLKKTKGIEGALLQAIPLATFPVPAGAWFNWGLFKDLAYLRDKLFYVHSKFSRNNFAPSSGNSLEMTIDKIMDQFEKKKMNSSSSFFIEKNGETFIGVLEPREDLFEIYRFSNR